MRSVIVVLVMVVFAMPVVAQDVATTRDVRGTQRAAKAEVVINQIDTSAFPKVTVFATVLKDGAPVKGLGSSDFRIREDEVDQAPITVEPKLTPLSVVVALDTSGSMRSSLGTAKKAAIDFIKTLDAEDKILPLGFARQVKKLSALSQDKNAAVQALQATTARGDTALYDALYSSVENLSQQPGRKAVILLSDGVDDDGYGNQLSQHSVADVLKIAKEVNVPIFTIGLGSEIDEKTLVDVATNSGAKYYNAPNPEALVALYESIGKQLSGQYNLYYTSNLPGDGSMHRIQLGYGDLVSIKEYQSPTVDSKPAVVAEPMATPQPPAAAKPISPDNPYGTPLIAGKSFTDAVEINIGETYYVKGKDITHFVKFPAQSGQFIQLAYARVAGARNHVEAGIFDPVKNKVVGERLSYGSAWARSAVGAMVAKGFDGYWYASVDSRNHTSFRISLTNLGDAGTTADVGAEEADALELSQNTPILGHLSASGDTRDWYLLDPVEKGKTYVVKLRPSNNYAARLWVTDQDGTVLGNKYSKNNGALVQLTVKAKDEGYFVITAGPRTSAKKGKAFSYNLVVAQDKVESPRAPRLPRIETLPNMQQ